MKFVIIFLLLIVLALGGGVAGLYLGFIPLGAENKGEPATKAEATPTPEPTAEPEEPMTPERMEEIIGDTSQMVPRDSTVMKKYYSGQLNKNSAASHGPQATLSEEQLGDKEFSEIDYEDSKERYKAKQRVSRNISNEQWEEEKDTLAKSAEEQNKETRAQSMEEWVTKNKDN